MNGPWHRTEPGRYAKEKAEIESAYTHLHFVEDGVVSVRGSFPIMFEGQEFDRYVIEMKLLQDYPKSLPVVWEIGGRIPRTADFHVNPADGTACILLPDERWRIWPSGSTLLQFLDGPVRNFFLSQSLVRLGESWPFGQWDHGAKGIREYYSELLKTDDVRVIIGFLEMLTRKKIKGHWPCPCRRGTRVRECHREFINDLATKIPRSVVVNSLEKCLQEYGGSE
jgi:hypothetical protein